MQYISSPLNTRNIEVSLDKTVTLNSSDDGKPMPITEIVTP